MSPPHTAPAPPPACNLGLKNLTGNTRNCSRRRQRRRGAKPS